MNSHRGTFSLVRETQNFYVYESEIKSDGKVFVIHMPNRIDGRVIHPKRQLEMIVSERQVEKPIVVCECAYCLAHRTENI